MMTVDVEKGHVISCSAGGLEATGGGWVGGCVVCVSDCAVMRIQIVAFPGAAELCVFAGEWVI